MCLNLTQQKLKIDNVNSSKLHYQLILKKYFNYLISKKLTKHTILVSKSEIKKFLEYLIKVNVKQLSKITNENIFNYISTLNKYKANTKSSKVSKIRLFLKFAYVYGFTTSDFSSVVPKVKINHNSVVHHTIWNSEEIIKIFKSINTSTNVGKRDYAMLMLISHLGLRLSDVKNLKFENINWKMNVININQSKTQKFVSLPLTNDVGNSLIDYIKNGRPNVNTKYIFLTDNGKPFGSRDNISVSFKKYLKLAGIDISDKKYIGVYTLRHSLATTLLQKRTPLSTISSILGHTDINNTAIYLKVDVTSLRECCLDLEV